MICKNCKNKKICNVLMAGGLIDLSCEDVESIARVGEEQEAEVKE